MMFTAKFNFARCPLIVFAFLTFVRADYYIDDSNSSVQYTPSIASSGQGSWWPLNTVNGNRFTNSDGNITLDYSRFYDQTL